MLRTADNLMANCENIAASLDVTADAKILTTVPLFSAYGFDFGTVSGAALRRDFVPGRRMSPANRC